jgi:hypothetical protein
VDLGYLKWKRGQMQAAADAAALDGAAALVSFGADKTRIISEAVTFGRANVLATDSPTAAVRDVDVKIVDGTIGATIQGYVEVTAGVTSDRGNPVNLFLGPILGRDLADVSATARASIWCATGSHCVKPWAIPTKFTWNDNADPNKKYQGNGKLDVASPLEMATVAVQGYSAADIGTQIVIKQGDPHATIAPGEYNPVDFPPTNKGQPVTGASEYQDNIEGCAGSSNTDVAFNDFLQTEPGGKVGPTKAGIDNLFAQDPGAFWDTSTQSIKGSKCTDPLSSPRVALLSFYDPRDPPTSGRDSIKIYQMGAVFIEGISGPGDVTARFINALAHSPTRDPAGTCGTLYGVSLVRDSSRQAP